MALLRVLLLESEDSEAARLERALFSAPLAAKSSISIKLRRARTAADAAEALSQVRMDAVLLGFSLSDAAGAEALTRLRAQDSRVPVVVLTGPAREEGDRLMLSLLAAVQGQPAPGLLWADGDPLVIVGRDGLIREANPAAEVLLSRGRDTLLGAPFPFPLAADQAVEVRILRSDGGTVFAQLRVKASVWGAEEAWAVVLRDVTDRKILQEALFQNIPTGILIERSNRRVFRANAFFCRMFGLAGLEELSEGDARALAKRVQGALAQPQRFPERIEEIVQSRQAVASEELLFADGAVFERDYFPVTSADIGLVAHLWLYRDISSRKQAIAKLEEQNQRLQELSQMKSNFVSTVSHELRTPLTIILSRAENLIGGVYGALSPQQLENLQKVQYHASRLQGMINSLLDLAKLEARKVELRLEFSDMVALARTTAASLQDLARAKEIELTQEAPGEVRRVRMDRARIEQVLVNIISNAVKHCPPKTKVKVLVKEGPSCVRVSVVDDGPGIAKRHLPGLFERFQQIERQQDLAAGSGIGLGLAISKEIVALHQGRIWVESEEGKGCSFIFELPLDLSVPKPASNRILVVDDEPAVCELVDIFLGMHGYQVTRASSIEEATRLIQDPGSRFDLAFLDLVLPGGSGVDVFKCLRRHMPETAVVILTGHSHTDLHLQALTHEPLTVLTKPFDSERLLAIARKLSPRRPPPSGGGQ